jgi:chromosome segregation ATPase
MINLTCTADAQKIIDNIKRLTAGSSSGLSQGGGSTIQKAKAVYSQCVQAKLNAIDSINLKYKNMITTLDDDIATTQQGVASLQTQITDNQNYFTQIQTLNKQASSDQLTNAISKAQSIQTQLQDLNTNSMTKLNNLNSQLQSTQSSLNSVSNQITLYGGEGKLALATGKTYEDTVSAFEKIRNKKTTFIKANCCETLKINTGYCAEGNKSKYQSDQGVE